MEETARLSALLRHARAVGLVPKTVEPMRVRDRVARALIRLYPAEFRDEYAGEMEQLVRDQSRAGGGWRWANLIVDIARTAPREHGSVLMNDLRYAIRMIARSPLFSRR